MRWIYLETTKNNFLVMFTKWEVPFRIEKIQCGSCLQKNTKQELKNYRPIYLLLVSSKIFERLFYDSMFKFFTENNLICRNQSAFKPSRSCINQLLSITHQIYKSFDDGHEVWSVFLDISKDCDKVWHKDLIFQLKENNISGNLLSTLTDIVKFGKERVVLNCQLSSWSNIE